jgi:PAS domain S-box-containing protein
MPVRDNGRVVRWFGTNTDISGQRRIEQALRKSEQRFRQIFENAPTGISIANWEGRIEQCNPALCALLGYTEEELRGRWFGSLIPEEDLDASLQGTARVRSGEIPFFHEESRYVRKNGEPVWVHKYLSVLPTEAGEVPHVVVLVTDISKSKEAEEKVRGLNTELEERVRHRTAQLEAANKELEAFAYSVSHDLRAPLRGIDGWSLALMEDYGEHLEPRAMQYLDRVRSETQRMGDLIDDLLQLSRISRAEMHRARVNLSAIAESIAARLKEAHAGRQLEFHIAPGLVALGDGRLLEVALTNLLENAVKFTLPRELAQIEFSGVPEGASPTFVVRDNGVGFDMTYAGQLFGAFQRLHSQSEFPGTGIGLATVQRVVCRHGGRIWAEAAPDRGAAFYFTLGEPK